MRDGKLIVYTGPMFAGKSTSLLDHLDQYDTVAVFKPDLDDRDETDAVVTHNGDRHPCTPIPPDATDHLRDTAHTELDAVGIDEAQFFDETLCEAINTVTAAGCDVIVAGLDRDFRRKGFGPMPRITDMADAVFKLYAECAVCERNAPYTQRLLDGRPAPRDAPTVVIGGSETYEPRCDAHHELPH